MTLAVSDSTASGISTITVTGTYETLLDGLGVGLIVQ
jgi:hypothetical protein